MSAGALPFVHSYAALPGRMFTRIPPTPVPAPRLLALNRGLAGELGLDAEWLAGPEGVAMLSGNALPEGVDPIAMAYAGHQFGNWNPQLGDGRAILLGEVETPAGRRDVQLKGAGPTPWSRGGDGRAWLGPVLREYLVSEAMAALGVPTTRALAAVATGALVLREEGPLPGAILTRVAASHVRVGTFQFFAARGDREALQALTDHVIARHYPEARGPGGLLAAVMARQSCLVAQWMGLGFIHGVMNTDNCAISGETIDYGPCAFLDGYHPDRVFSFIDRMRRYAYGNQPRVLHWNMAQLATALVPLMPDTEAAIEEFTLLIDGYGATLAADRAEVMAAKIGLPPSGAPLAEEFLALMQAGESDWTNSFAALTAGDAGDQILDREAYTEWAARWQAAGPDRDLMARVNPVVIPRTHRIEAIIEAARLGDLRPFEEGLAVFTRPFAVPDPVWTRPPRDEERVRNTFCGT